jgi:hypothetical protein
MKTTGMFVVALILLYVSVGAAQQYPIMDKVATR